MPVTFVIRFNVVPAERQRFLDLLTRVLDAMRDEPMFHQAILHQDPDEENRFMLYETWEDLDDVIVNQLRRPYREAWHAALPELLVGERDIAIWQPLHAARRAA